MSFLRRAIIAIGIIGLVVVITGCDDRSEGKDEKAGETSIYKGISRIDYDHKDVLENYKFIDWTDRALGFDRLVFNESEEGTYLPLIWEDETYGTFGLPAYVGDPRQEQDGAQEAVTNIAAVLSASLLGIDKSEGVDYVSELGAFYSEEEKIILNNPAGSSETTSMWYLLYPTILFTQVAHLYEDHEEINEYALTAIESWYEAYEIMYNDGDANFDYTGFNFKTMTPYNNDIWIEPDSAVGIGLLMYYAYELTDDKKYLEASIHSMDYIEDYFGSPLYEVLMYYAPYLAAKLNDLGGTNYDVAEMLNKVFSETAIPRGGWGSIVGKWGDYFVNGLFGSTSDGGGYAFAMNTFAATGAIVPVVQYDARYAKSIGEWMLHAVNHSRYYFATETGEKNQSCTYVEACEDIDSRIKEFIPYEGIRKESQGRTPWFGGDPTVYDWAETDFSLYSGAHTGILAALVDETNVEGILRIDLQATNFFSEHHYPTYLLYNPYDKEKKVDYFVGSDVEVDLFNTVTNTVIGSGVSDQVTLDISGDEAIVIVEIPKGSEVVHKDKAYYVEDQIISRDLINLNIKGLKHNESVSGKFTLDLELAANYETEIDEIVVEIDGEQLTFEAVDKVKLNTKDFKTGAKRISVNITTVDGMTDKASIRLNFK